MNTLKAIYWILCLWTTVLHKVQITEYYGQVSVCIQLNIKINLLQPCISSFILLFALMAFCHHLSTLEGGHSVNSRQSQSKEHLDKSWNICYYYFVVPSHIWARMRILKKLTDIVVKWFLIWMASIRRLLQLLGFGGSGGAPKILQLWV